MFEETFVEGAKDILALLGRSGILQEAYLAGGTGAALQLGHRISVDFDFFTAKEFIPKNFSTALSKLGSFVNNSVAVHFISFIYSFKSVSFFINNVLSFKLIPPN